jgi:hypothetical protein
MLLHERRISMKKKKKKREKKSCKCPECVSACNQTPGWFLPGEAEKVAKYLKMKFEKFRKKYLVIDCWYTGDCDIWAYSPRKGNDDSSYLRNTGAKWEDSSCIFLKDGLCEIHNVKPKECKIVFCCGENSGGISDARESVVQQWKLSGNPLEGEQW